MSAQIIQAWLKRAGELEKEADHLQRNGGTTTAVLDIRVKVAEYRRLAELAQEPG